MSLVCLSIECLSSLIKSKYYSEVDIYLLHTYFYNLTIYLPAHIKYAMFLFSKFTEIILNCTYSCVLPQTPSILISRFSQVDRYRFNSSSFNLWMYYDLLIFINSLSYGHVIFCFPHLKQCCYEEPTPYLHGIAESYSTLHIENYFPRW